MKNKILITILCLLSFLSIGDVKARACTDEEIANARAALTSSRIATIPIPTLGRTKSTGKVNIFKMTLTHNGNGTVNNSFCMNGEKPAHTGLLYKIDYKIPESQREWYKAYQYATDNKDEPVKYMVAQAAIWVLSQHNGQAHLIANAAQDIYVSMNCATLIGNAANNSQLIIRSVLGNESKEDYCSRVLDEDDSTNKIIATISKIYMAQSATGIGLENRINALLNEIRSAQADYDSFNTLYPGPLYRWIEVTDPNRYQGMLAPLTCGDETNYSCTDSSGNVHDYTNEYQSCVLSGETPGQCITKYNSLYCGTNRFGVIARTGSGAVCSNAATNLGSYNEEVDTTVRGNAIPGKGEPEQLVSSYCNLFCIENSAQQIFPGNIRQATSTGTYVIWPTSEHTLSSVYKNEYPLKFSGQKTCYVVMAGTDNPVNTTNINNVYQNLVRDASNSNAYGSYAGRNYEYSRTHGGCESVYSDTTGVCKEEFSSMNGALADLNNHKNNPHYISAIAKQQQNSNKCWHDYDNHQMGGIPCTGNFCTEVNYFCSIDENSASCNTIKQQCANQIQQQQTTGCTVGNGINLTHLEQQALSEYSRLENIYNQKKATYDSCQAEKAACNTYTENVNKVVRFANEIKKCATYTPNCSGGSCDIYNFGTNVDLSWGDPEYGTTIYDSQLEKTKNYSSYIEGNTAPSISVDASQSFRDINSNTGGLITEVTNIVQYRKIIANVGVTYSLPTNNLLYNYVVKRNDTYVSQTAMPPAGSNYTTIGFSNLPISFNAESGTLYDLTLSNIRFGDNGGQYSPSDYNCNYEVTKTPSTSCLCPVGTVYEGKNLSSFIIDNNMTCYEAQQAFCDRPSTTCPNDTSIDLTACISQFDYFTCYDKYCRNPISTYCPNRPEIDLTTCLNNYNYNYCYNLLCLDPNIDNRYRCLNTNGVDGPMDITSCVYTKIAQGLSESDAVRECDALICPLTGIRIIYRTISLENPFPGKNISNKVLGFNDDVKGRYPGTNWNDLRLVQNHILTSRGYDGSAIYQGEPLYTFVLTTGTINAIRNYNEQRELNGGYADFTLDCKLNNSRACVSDFVHDPSLSGLVSGVCSSSTSRNNFYVCSGDN